MSKTLLSVNINGAKPYSYTSGVERTIAMNASKLLKLYDYAKRYRYAVVCIQETHSEKVGDISDYIFSAYKDRPNFYLKVAESININNPNRGGTAIMCLDPEMDLSYVNADYADPINWKQHISLRNQAAIEDDAIYGRWIVGKIKWNQLEVHIASIYAPTLRNQVGYSQVSHIAREGFWKSLTDKWAHYPNLLVGGDTNNTPDPNFDKRYLQPVLAPPTLENMDSYFDFLTSNDLYDTYTQQYDPQFGPVNMTHRSTTGKTESRLDKWFNSNSMMEYAWIDFDTTNSTDTRPLPFPSDHYPISITLHAIQMDDIKFPKLWRLNTSIFLKPDILSQVADFMEEQFKYAEENGDAIRAYELFKSKSRRLLKDKQSENSIRVRKISDLAYKKLQPNSTYSEEEKIQADIDLKQIEKYRVQSAFIHSKDKIITQSSQMTKAHFLNAKIRQKQERISEIVDEHNRSHTTQEGIEIAAVAYWSKIMSKKDIDQDSMKVVLESIDKVLPIQSAQSLTDNTHLISTETIKAAIQASATNKSPGIDGLPNEFYEALIPQKDGMILKFLQKVFLQAKRESLLPPSMRKIAIKLLYKYEDKANMIWQKNYRPISLLSCDYKILSRILQTNLNPLMHYILYDTQFCAPGKQIGEAVLYLSTLIDYTEHNQSPAALAFLDFEKAFDSVSHEAIFRIMEQVGLPQNFIEWAKLAFTQTSASLIINGGTTSEFPLTGGGRQGDNLFPLLFVIVVQALAAMITRSGAKGVTILNHKQLLTQYADDTTLIIGEDEDWAKYERVIHIFCKATGMKINWGKSVALMLGLWNKPNVPRPIQCPPQLTFVQDGTATRVLGIQMGTNLNQPNLMLKMEEKLQRALTKKLRHCGDELGDTITVNSLLLALPIFQLRLQFCNHSTLEKFNNWARAFARGKVYLLTNQQRYASRQHGNLIPMIDLNHLNITLQAKWFYEIINHAKQAPCYIFSPMWLEYIPRILLKHQFKTLDHMIHAQMDFSKTKVKNTKELPAFPHQCLLNYCTLGFHRQLPHTLEEYMNQPLFLNRHIIDLNTAQSWTRNKFSNITLSKLYRIGDLFVDCQLDRYSTFPEISNLPHPLTTSHLLNSKFSTPKKQINIPIAQWISLIDSIPPLWMNRILQGNQTFIPGEFLAYPALLNPDKISTSDVYQYLSDGTLQYFRFIDPPSDGVIQKSGIPYFPGDLDILSDHPDVPYPQLSELRRLTTYPIDEDMGLWQITTYTLPSYKHSESFKYNIQFGQYKHNIFPDQDYKTMAKNWRHAFSSIHPKTLEFIHKVEQLGFINTPAIGLGNVMKSINRALIPPQHKVFLWKFINKALYIGEVGYSYQIHVKHVNPANSFILVPNFCIYSHYILNTLQPATYQWIFWDSPQAKLLWRHLTLILLTMGAPLNITSPYQIPLIFLPNVTTTPSLLELTRQTLIVGALYTLYTAERILVKHHQLNQLQGSTKLSQWPVEVYSFFNKELQTQALLAPFMQHELNKRTQIPNSKGELVLEHTLRQIMFFTDPVVNINNLTQDQVDTFTSFWTKTIVLKIEDNIRLRFLHFHNYPIDFYPP